MRTPRAKCRRVLWLVMAGAIGCTESKPRADRFVVFEEEGAIVAESTAPRLEGVRFFDSVPALSIAGDFGAPDYYLYGAHFAAILAGGRLVVGNAGAKQLLFFDATGRLENVVGRAGDGPGEFQAVFDLLHCDQDGLIVEEVSRISIVDGAQQSFVRTVPIVGHLAPGRTNIAGVRPDCSAVLISEPELLRGDVGPGVQEMMSTLMWAELDTGVRDTVETFPAYEVTGWAARGRRFPVRVPYGRSAVWAVHPDGVVLGLADSARFEVFAADGEKHRIVRWAAAPRAVSDDDWDYYAERWTALLDEHPEERDLAPPADHFSPPSTKPAYSKIAVDAAGRFWVQRYDLYGAQGPDTSVDWWVFTGEGEWLANVQMPVGFEALGFGSRSIVGVTVDELGVETIQVYNFDFDDHSAPSA